LEIRSGVVFTREWWSTRWYTPIVVLAALLLVLLIAGLAAVEHFAGALSDPSLLTLACIPSTTAG
jgi:hypothetical protein